MWQNILVITILIAALAYLGRRFFLKSGSKKGCDGCN